MYASPSMNTCLYAIINLVRRKTPRIRCGNAVCFSENRLHRVYQGLIHLKGQHHRRAIAVLGKENWPDLDIGLDFIELASQISNRSDIYALIATIFFGAGEVSDLIAFQRTTAIVLMA